PEQPARRARAGDHRVGAGLLEQRRVLLLAHCGHDLGAPVELPGRQRHQHGRVIALGRDDDPVASPTPAAATTPPDGNDDTDGLLNTAPPASPTESLSNAPTDPALDKEPDIPGDTCEPGQKCPAAGDCDESRWFKPATLGGRYHWAIGPSQANYNG